MHRIPQNIDLSPLIGLEVIQVSVGANEVIVHFHPHGTIRVEGLWFLRRHDGSLIDRSMPHADRDSWRIHHLIGKVITECAISDASRLEFRFADLTLELVDDSDSYETFSIELPNLKLYV